MSLNPYYSNCQLVNLHDPYTVKINNFVATFVTENVINVYVVVAGMERLLDNHGSCSLESKWGNLSCGLNGHDSPMGETNDFIGKCNFHSKSNICKGGIEKDESKHRWQDSV